jgi:acyl-CoA synthetase (AMP-forming)/AMP-acid ligase II
MDMKIIDAENNELPAGEIGEIIGKGPLLMTEYYKNPVQTNEALKDGWLCTGDLGYVDEDGFLFLTGRKKDMIISGGVNVYPSDIEEVIIRHPVVKDVAVFGVPNKDWGETPVAAIVLKDGANILTCNEVKNWINDNVGARYQKVSDVLFINELPRNVAGKILKRELKENYINNSCA